MPLPSTPSAAPLTPDLAFVVQLRSVDRQRPENLAGRVEHIASGQALGFSSLTELRAFMNKYALLGELHGFIGQTAGPKP